MKRKPPAMLEGAPQIDYPCEWLYKVIGEDPVQMTEIIRCACAPAEVTITASHTSSGGRYHSLNATLVVEDEQTRLAIYNLLQNHPAISFVL